MMNNLQEQHVLSCPSVKKLFLTLACNEKCNNCDWKML